MRLKYLILAFFLLNLNIVLANSISLDLNKYVYAPTTELQGMCVLELDDTLDLGIDPKISLTIGNRIEERNAIDVLASLDPRLDLEESAINLVDSETQKTLDLSSESFFGLKLPREAQVKNIDFDITGVNSNGYPNSPYIDFNDDGMYEWYYAGTFAGWSNNVVNAKGLSGVKANEDLIINDNILLYCSIVDLPYANKFNVSADINIDDNQGNISIHIFEFDSNINLAFNKKGDCTLRNSPGQTQSCIVNTGSYLSGEHFVCFYNSENQGSYLLSLDEEGEGSYECDSILLDNGETECNFVEDGDFFIKAFEPIYQGDLNKKVNFSGFGTGTEFADLLTDYLAECETEGTDCDLVLGAGSSNNAGKLILNNFKIEYSKSGGSTFVTRRAYDVDYESAKILGFEGDDFENYSLDIPLAIFDNLTIPNITTNKSTKNVRILLGELEDEVEIEINRNLAFSTQDIIDSAIFNLDYLKSRTELTDFFQVYGVNIDSSIQKLEDFENDLASLDNNSLLSFADKITQTEEIGEQVNSYLDTLPENIQVNEDVSYPRIYPEKITEEILGNEDEEQVLASQDDVDIETNVKLIVIDYFNGDSFEKTLIKRTLSTDLNNYFIFEEIPKEVAESTDTINFGSDATVVNNDPLIKWNLQGSGDISYVLDGNVLSKLNKITTIVLPSSLESTDFEENTCGDGICTEILEDEISCPADCEAKYDINWPLTIILILVLILGLIYFNIFMGKRSLKSVVKKSPFSSPADETNLKNYITNALEKKIPKDSIYKILLQKKWTNQQIDYVFKKVQPSESKLKFILDVVKKRK